MHNIILIGTVHIENGQCNSSELYKIIESINPDVIFDEIPSCHFNSFYVTQNQRSLESDAINQYLKTSVVQIIPVDIDVRQEKLEYQNEINSFFYAMFKNEDYIKLENEKEELIRREGFKYLNSDEFLDFLERKEGIEKKIIASESDKNRLLNVYELFHGVEYDKRESAMLQNIYKYSKENQYNQAVFLLGAGHRKTVMEKITKFEKLSDIKLNWKIYSNNENRHSFT